MWRGARKTRQYGAAHIGGSLISSDNITYLVTICIHQSSNASIYPVRCELEMHYVEVH